MLYIMCALSPVAVLTKIVIGEGRENLVISAQKHVILWPIITLSKSTKY